MMMRFIGSKRRDDLRHPRKQQQQPYQFEGGVEQNLPKKDVYAALWAMLDVESENKAEDIPGQWDLDNVLHNWGRIEPDVGPAGHDQ
ncbi:hypothetical protein PIB30_008711 [Stylosanthes scabra]|uniref:Uncharacterized protein n=1 Tax=Stylosanthes scabra TaxID=79078 RepID=A0ABU6U4E8_9FABA|nr:hypothetical protein [Stylosanthes scabra]